MKRFVLLLTIAMLSATAFAQLELIQNVFDNTEFTPNYSEGSWAEYKIIDKGGKASNLKFSVLKVDPEGKEPFVFEMKMTDSEGMWTITQFAGSDPMDKGSFSYMITQRKGETARKMDVGQMASSLGTVEPEKETAEASKAAEDISVEIEKDVVIEVPAGKFETVRATITNDEMVSHIWFSEKAGPFGMVKAEQIGQGGAELLAHGDKATSEITGKVEEVKLPNLENLIKMAIPQPGN